MMTLTHTSRSRHRHRRQRRSGFTLVEMMVALTIGAMVIASVYTIGSSAARHFQEQQRVSQLQLSVRLALDRIRRDAGRAGYLGTMNSATDMPCGPLPAPQIRGVLIQNPSPAVPAALTTQPGFGGTGQADRLDITGNFRTGDAYAVQQWQSNQLLLNTEHLNYHRSFTANPATAAIDVALFASTFAAGTPIMARLGGMRFWTTATAANADAIGSRATITTAATPACLGDYPGWGEGGILVAPVSMVRYEILDAPAALTPRVPLATGPNTVLMRTEMNPLTGAILDGPNPILEYAVHFDVDTIRDITPPGPLPPVLQIQNDGAAALATNNFPGSIRGLRISLAARTPESDPRLSGGIAPLADGTPRAFQVGIGFAGNARVRSAYTEVFLPNAHLN